jgi:hypothetical protein
MSAFGGKADIVGFTNFAKILQGSLKIQQYFARALMRAPAR